MSLLSMDECIPSNRRSFFDFLNPCTAVPGGTYALPGTAQKLLMRRLERLIQISRDVVDVLQSYGDADGILFNP